MQMNLVRKVSLLEFRAASSSVAVKPTPSARIGFGRAGAAGHRKATRLERSARNLGDLLYLHFNRKIQRGYVLKYAPNFYSELQAMGLHRLQRRRK